MNDLFNTIKSTISRSFQYRKSAVGILVTVLLYLLPQSAATIRCLIGSVSHALLSSQQYDCNAIQTTTTYPLLIAFVLLLIILVMTAQELARYFGLWSETDYEITNHERKTGDYQVNRQTTYSIPQLGITTSKNLIDINQILKSYLKSNLNDEYLSNTITNKGEKETIFGLANTRFSNFLAIASEDGQLLMFDRRDKEKHVTTKNEKYDFFGSVGYENSSIQKKIV